MLNRAKLICTSLHNAFGVPRQNVFTSIYHYRNREPAPGARYMDWKNLLTCPRPQGLLEFCGAAKACHGQGCTGFRVPRA